MIGSKRVSLVIPCKNEEKNIKKLFRSIPKCVDEVIIVDNNSTDNTAMIARKLGATVHSETRTHLGIGYGYAHQTGLKKATGDIVVTMDGDNSYPLAQVKNAVQFMVKHNYDFVSCARFPLQNPKAINPIRQLGVAVLNLEVYLLYNYRINDILSGMWIVNKKAKRSLKIQSGGWNYSPEIKLAALTHPSLQFSEFSVNQSYRYDGQSKQIIWVTGFDHLFFIAKYYLYAKAILVHTKFISIVRDMLAAQFKWSRLDS